MIYDVIEEIGVNIQPTFSENLDALALAKGLSDVDTALHLHLRFPAETFVALGFKLPGLGIYVERVRTQAVRQHGRDNLVSVVLDYFARGAKAEPIAKQTELAAEALLKTIDRLWRASAGLYGAGEEDRSIDVRIAPILLDPKQNLFESRALIRFLVNEEERGLDP